MTQKQESRLRQTLRITGQVQGVGFRPFVYRIAHELNLAGSVWNDQSGVTINAHGPGERLDRFRQRLIDEVPALARIDTLDCTEEVELQPSDEPVYGFTIQSSDAEPAERGWVTIDSAVCPDCTREMFAPDDRRHRHALINCTNCGPRLTIVRDLPYDRPRTTMAAFEMCPRCTAEYGDPADRRFHAQPTCCPDCGPRVRLLDGEGSEVDGDPFVGAARILCDEGVLIMKGLGGYHLVARADADPAIARLRRGKRRDAKPFALMVASIDEARRLVRLSGHAAALIQSPICPIVLASRIDTAADGRIGDDVAPDCHRLGIMLAYTPMQHLLLAEPELDGAALIMTSANLSDDPLIKDDEEALARLGGLCDGILVHDRPIERAVDDSIVIDAPQGILPIRRARGYVPSPLTLPIAAERPGLCTGGELKNTVAVVRGGHAILSQHIGDLTYSLAYERFERTIDDLQRLFDIDIQWVACDAHPRYASSAFARRLADTRGIDRIVVQHHHAHLTSLLAEHGRSDRIVGLICDGVGYGDDGTAWGGEVLAGDLRGYERPARIRPLLLPGGDAAAKQTGRCAAGWLFDLHGEQVADHPLLPRLLPDERERGIVVELLRHQTHCPPSSGLGRLFDAAAALLGICDYNHYEAMSGMLLEAAAAGSRDQPPGDDVIPLAASPTRPELLELDHRALLERLETMLRERVDVGACAWFFHDAIADGLSRAARIAADGAGVSTVGLSGGVFCNTLLTRLVVDRLRSSGHDVLVHRHVPPNDGGIALGQAAVAAACRVAQGKV